MPSINIWFNFIKIIVDYQKIKSIKGKIEKLKKENPDSIKIRQKPVEAEVAMQKYMKKISRVTMIGLQFDAMVRPLAITTHGQFAQWKP